MVVVAERERGGCVGGKSVMGGSENSVLKGRWGESVGEVVRAQITRRRETMKELKVQSINIGRHPVDKI